MPYKNINHKTHRQRQQRRAQQVKRVEFVLDADSARDHEIHDYLISLPPGTVGEFIRAAIHEKITGSQPSVATHASGQFNAILAELAALREVVSQPVQVETNARRSRANRQPTASRVPDTIPLEPALTVSSGLEMGAPRRPRANRTPLPPPTLAEAEPPFDPEASARLLVESIKGFGKNRSPDPHL